MPYDPRPIDTAAIPLDRGLEALVEYLARNTHDVWARGRIAQGWSWGPQRDDGRKHHPGLVEYNELSEEEKWFDRETAVQTLKTILALGYRIEPPGGPAQSGRIANLPTPGQLTLTALIDLWKGWDHGTNQGPGEIYAALGERALKLGEYLLGYEILTNGLKFHPSDLRLRQLQALALARSGATESARLSLERLKAEGHQDEETLSLLARTLKDAWEQSGDPSLLREACDRYEQAYRLSRGVWSGINAATLAACQGDSARATSLAGRVRQQCREALGVPTNKNDYWLLATLAESALVLGDWQEAGEAYQRAAVAAKGVYGNISSTRRNARLLLRALGKDEKVLDDWLRLPRVVVCAGHMIDRPGRPVPRFPAEIEAKVAAELRRKLDELDAGFGYSAAACGADILFLEAMIDRGAEVNIILPYGEDRFVADSVAIVPGSDWEERFRRLLQHPGARVSMASDAPVDAIGLATEFANTFTFGLAGIRAWQLGAELAPLAVWDGREGDGPGGTSSAVAQWNAFGCRATIINPREMFARDAATVTAPPPAPAAASTGFSGTMMALLFADVVGFSKLTEPEIPLFARHFLGGVADLIARSKHKPVQTNTWGDGLYFTFSSASAAGQFALELRDFVVSTKWEPLGFHNELSLRTGLHVGPVYKCENPVTGREDYIGTHVSRAARIEPITPRGQVYASEVFAAIAFAQRAEGFTCDYVGKIGLAKDYGTYPTYHVRPKRSGRQ